MSSRPSSKPKQAILIYNPQSGKGKGEYRAEDFSRAWHQKSGQTLQQFPSSSFQDLRQGIKETITSGKTLIVMGGDGTLSETVQALAERHDFKPVKTPLGFLPSGTGNSFLRDLGISNYKDARDKVIKAIEKNATIAVDVGVISYKRQDKHVASTPGGVINRITMNIWGIGLISDITALALKFKKLGPFCYTLASIIKILRYKPLSVQAKINGRLSELNGSMITVSNSCYTGGKMKIAPDIRINDGRLFFLCVPALNRVSLLRLLPKVISGNHTVHPQIRTEFIQTLELYGEQAFLMNVDGELVTGFNPRIAIAPRFFRLYGEEEFLEKKA